ncbi:hypothetical protein [Rhodococcus phenolicus]|uniref:hypothetical protein n=1 Tax=Rhodococcus phenolicus TaxID=263849 RepID=UPI00083046EE|nr:hypothetical protein [Rhodococcus phenolicus]
MRHPLDNFIAGWLDENSDVHTELYVADDENNDSDGMVSIEGELNVTALVRAVAAEFAVVELPEPTEARFMIETAFGYQAWEAGPVRVTVCDNGTFDFFATNTIGNKNPDGLRRAAAALLAAANRAEAQQ